MDEDIDQKIANVERLLREREREKLNEELDEFFALGIDEDGNSRMPPPDPKQGMGYFS